MGNINETNLKKIQSALESFKLPGWDELPSIYLYMDQVIELTTGYFSEISSLLGDEKILTAPMINNYIKLKAMPSPVKKRYGKPHLAYLIMISTLKQSMNISSMESVIPLLDDEDKIREMYTSFVHNQRQALSSLKEVVTPIIDGATEKNGSFDDIVLQIVLASTFMKVFTSGIAVSNSEKPEKTDDKKSVKAKKESDKSPNQESDENED
ncbi:MAG: DUF1836 domain-containing protein [Clostridia bacterium]|nr:DUF1836 domain-containing protein [Clostridia bacterium]